MAWIIFMNEYWRCSLWCYYSQAVYSVLPLRCCSCPVLLDMWPRVSNSWLTCTQYWQSKQKHLFSISEQLVVLAC